MQAARWLSRYQTLVNKIVEGNYLQFTTEVWSPMEPSTNKTSNNNANKRQIHSLMEKWMKRVKLCTTNVFPFLGMKMMWDNMGFLQFGVYHEEGQAIKYIYIAAAATYPACLNLLHLESTYNLVG
eukprot:1467982-Ditylum_brightwellii.AAC.2